VFDQANHLRRLVRQCATPDTPASDRRPGMIVATSGKGGVGTTTIAVNLAVALARCGNRTVLVDADPRGGNVALHCRLEDHFSVADVFAARKTVCESLQPGPGEIRVLAGAWGLRYPADYPPAAGERLLSQLQNLQSDADLVVVDVGSGPSGLRRRFLEAADVKLLVTTPETASVLDTYAAIKALAGSDKPHSIHTLVNLAGSAETAQRVHARLAEACRRFLGVETVAAGRVPAEAQLAATARTATPLALGTTQTGAARELQRLATTLADAVAAAKARRPEGQFGSKCQSRIYQQVF